MKRGAIPSPRSALAAATPHVIPSHAVPVEYLYLPQQITFWHNDITGDCVTAEEAFAKACYTPEIFIPPKEVKEWAQAHGYWNGAVLSDVLSTMRTSGFKHGANTYSDGAARSVDWTHVATLESAIFQGPVKLGVAGDPLQNVVTPGANGWFAVGFTQDQNEDHCVSLCGYGSMNYLAKGMGVSVPGNIDGAQPGYAMFCWDSIGIIDVPSMLAITGEAWVRTPTTIIS